MSRTSLRRPAMVLAGLALMCAPLNAQPSAGRARLESLPPDCLAAGAVADAATALRRAGEILSALTGNPGDASLRAGMGSRIRNPDLAGVDLSAPASFFYMNPKVFPRPWVYQFGVTDAEALKKALASDSRAAQEGEAVLRLDGRQATWSLDAKAADGVIQWQKQGGKLPDFRAAGQFQARLDVQGFLGAFDADFAAQVQLMKGRVREALQRGGRKDAAVEKEIADVQAELDSAVGALRQVRDADFAISFEPAFVRVGMDARLMEAAPLRALFRAHAPGDLRLLGLCPPEAGVVVVNNLSFVKAAGRMLLNMAGLPFLEKPEPGAGAGRRAIALFFPQQAGDAGAGAPVELLDLRDGDEALRAREEWDRLARPAITGQAGNEPFSLSPVKAEPPPAGLRLAIVEPNEAALQPEGAAVFHRLLGGRVEAAQEFRGDICITAVGGAAAERVRQAEALAEAKKGSLADSPGFQKSMAQLPEKPNLLVYVSADALRGWFALGGRVSSKPIPADAMGLAAAAAIDGDGIRFLLKFPTACIPAAK